RFRAGHDQAPEKLNEFGSGTRCVYVRIVIAHSRFVFELSPHVKIDGRRVVLGVGSVVDTFNSALVVENPEIGLGCEVILERLDKRDGAKLGPDGVTMRITGEDRPVALGNGNEAELVDMFGKS